MMVDPKSSFSHDDLETAMKENLFVKGRPFSKNVLIGKVVNNKDSEKLGRCQIMVYGYFDNLPTEDLPYATPDFGLNGEFIVPTVGSLVSVYFENEDIMNPHYTTKIINRNAISNVKDDDYPNTIVIYDDLNGNKKYFNRRTGESVEKFTNGVEINTDINGDMEIDTTACTTGNITINGRSILKLDAAIIETPAGTVIPGVTGGLNCLVVDPILGISHAGTTLIRSG